MQWICHDWSDAHCLKLLGNCYEALSENGKVIIAESILTDDPNGEEAMRVSLTNLMMMAMSQGGRERTEKEFRALADQAGFKQFTKRCAAFNLWIIELHKSN